MHELKKSSLEIDSYKIEKNYLYNAKCIIYKKMIEKLELLKKKPIEIKFL